MDSPLDWITHPELARLTGAHRTTVRRWKLLSRAGWLPVWLERLVNAVHRGQLGEIHPAWHGWMINQRDGELVTPEGVCVTMGQIRAIPYLRDLARVNSRARDRHHQLPVLIGHVARGHDALQPARFQDDEHHQHAHAQPDQFLHGEPQRMPRTIR